MVSIAIVRSEFNEEITNAMLAEARKHAKRLGVRIVAEVTVPGAFDMPVAIQKMLERGDVDGVATLGAVIKGETKHDELISYQVSRAIVELSLKHKKPIGLGVMGPGITTKQAKARVAQYSRQSVEAVFKVHCQLNGIRGSNLRDLKN